MKKIISMVLLLVMCLGLAACDYDGEGKTDSKTNRGREIVGEWTEFTYGYSVAFRVGGTGRDNSGGSFTWKYDEDLKYYTIAVQTEEGVSTFDTMIQKTKHPAITYITIRGERFYRMEKDNLKDCKVITVVSKDMSPTIKDGDTILCAAVTDPADLSVGDIIAYWTVLDGQRVAYASRIQNIYDGGGYLLFETKDDNNENSNPLPVHQAEILGEFTQVLIAADAS
jgi:signal peptidase I